MSEKVLWFIYSFLFLFFLITGFVFHEEELAYFLFFLFVVCDIELSHKIKESC
jgi:hypothetical protein